MSLLAGIANRLYAASALRARWRFERALRHPQEAQRAALMRIVGRNANSRFGARFGFSTIRSVSDFRARVPITDYDALAPEIERIASGERAVLTSDDVFRFEPTTGGASASKLIPYTRALMGEFSAATSPWIFDLLRHRAPLRNGRAYWAVSPRAGTADRTPGGIAVGMEHDSDYFPAFARALLDQVLGTPRALSRAPTIEAARYLTLRSLLALPDLAFVSVWSPSFLTLLARALDEHWATLIDDLDKGTLSIELDAPLRATLSRVLPANPARAAMLRRRFGHRPPQDLGEVWNGLALISCWTDGHAARALDAMRSRFPRVEVQGKGLLATEGVVSIPLFAAGGRVAALTSHYLEFIPEGGADALGAHELQEGRAYEVLLTTSGGLYRYRLRDLVRVDGWHHRAPLVTFLGRADRTSDLAGEKLSPSFAEAVLERAMCDSGVRARFAVLAPVWGKPPSYHLFVECEPGDAARLACAVEAGLMQAHHYALCRRLGQLGVLQVGVIVDGEATFERVCIARGQRAGAIKPTALDANLGWEREFVALDAARSETLGAA